MTAIDQDRISFHEATLISISYADTTVRLALVDVLVEENQRAAEVAIDGVTSILRDSVPVGDLKMEKEDAEVLTLRKDGDRVILVLEWNDFAQRSQETVVYTFAGPRVALRIESIEAAA